MPNAPIAYEALAPRLQTGDVFLFNGTTEISKIIDAMTHSPFSHIGMVYRTPGSSGVDGLQLWQSFEPDGGVIVGPLADFLTRYVKLEAGASFAARLLQVERTPAMLAATDAFIVAAKGKPFPNYGPWLINYLSACLGIEMPQTSFYCSELVAQTYIQMGLLRAWPYAAVYTPGRFSEEAYDLQFQLGASLGAETAVAPPQMS